MSSSRFFISEYLHASPNQAKIFLPSVGRCAAGSQKAEAADAAADAKKSKSKSKFTAIDIVC
jgi:hypothetical protein